MVLYGVTLNRELGVDLEYQRPVREAERIAERFFSPRENRAFRELPASCRQEAFFRCWTRKEAYIKARGGGLSIPLHGFDVSLRPGEPARLLSTSWDPEESSRWSLGDIPTVPGYEAAVAIEGRMPRLHCWSLPEAFLL
jgi:4'-phosphopantetheinyl transferase